MPHPCEFKAINDQCQIFRQIFMQFLINKDSTIKALTTPVMESIHYVSSIPLKESIPNYNNSF